MVAECYAVTFWLIAGWASVLVIRETMPFTWEPRIHNVESLETGR